MKSLAAKTSVVTKIILGCSCALWLSGCVETAAQREPVSEVPKASNMTRRDGVSPRGASVAITELQGLPGSASERLSQLFEAEAGARDVNLTDPKKAKYLVRGYLNVAPAEGGATYAMVYDVYDAKKRRAQRIDDEIYVKGAAPEAVDDMALRQIASKSAEDLAAVLTNMPEAVAIAPAAPAGGEPPAPAQVAADEGTTTVAGTVASGLAPATLDTGRSVAALH